jgi:glycosyltransferase involved in cell wall biosynthesis
VRSKKYGIYLRGEKINEYFFDSLIISRANFILTVSPFFKEKLKHLNKDIEVIKPMIDISITDFFYCEKPINKEIIKILFVGRVEKRKGIFELLEIAKMIKFSSKQLQIDVVGGGELIEEINYLIVQNEIGHIIKLHGQVSDKLKLKEFYINSDLFLFLSHDEGFPRVLYEAMAYKLPIFTTFVGGIPGRMVNGFNCVEVPLQDPIKTFETILIQLCDQKKMSTIALNGQKTISKIINKSEISHHILLKKKIKV